MSSLSISSTLQRPDFSTLRKQFDQTIDSDVTSGKISSDDATAIKSAEDDLSKLFDGSSAGSNATTTGSDPSQLKAKVDTFIDGEVTSGKLTSAQADELKSVLQKGHAGGHGGHGGHAGGVGGTHKKSSGLDALLQSNDDDSSTSSGSTDTSSTDATTLLDKLIRQLQSNTGTDTAQKPKPQFVDYQA